MLGFGLGKQHPRPLPTIEEVQGRVGATPDGILGPETQKKWERITFNQYAAQYMTESGCPK